MQTLDTLKTPSLFLPSPNGEFFGDDAIRVSLNRPIGVRLWGELFQFMPGMPGVGHAMKVNLENGSALSLVNRCFEE